MAEANSFLLDRHWPYRLHVLATCVSQTLARVYAERFGITVPEWRIIAVLGGLGPDEALSGTEISTRTAIDRVQVSRAMARMLDTRLIVRGTARADRRTAQVSLTEAGRRIYDRIVPLARAYEARLLSALAPEDRGRLDQLVATLQTEADAIAALSTEGIAALIDESPPPERD